MAGHESDIDSHVRECATQAEAGSAYAFAEFTWDARRGLCRRGDCVVLPPKESVLLRLLLGLQGEVASHALIEQQVWPGQVVRYESVTRCVYSLRRLLGDSTKQIVEAVPRRGYRIGVPVRRLTPGPRSVRVAAVATTPLSFAHYQAGTQAANVPRAASQQRATALFAASVESDPSNASALASIADTQMYRVIRGWTTPGRALEEGMAACGQALALDPGNVAALAARGWFRGLLLDDLDGAWRDIEQAVEADPDYSRTQVYRSWLFRAEGDAVEALAAARSAVELDPHNLLNRNSLCWALYLAGHTQEALNTSRRIAEAYADDDIAWGFMGIFLADLGYRDEALASTARSLELGSDTPLDWAAAAYVNARTGRAAEALALLEAALAKSDPPCPCTMAAPGYLALGEVERASTLLHEGRVTNCPWAKTAALDPRLAGLVSPAH